MDLGVATIEGSLDEALSLGAKAASLAASSGRALLVSVALEAEAVVLGALQREASVRELSPARFHASVARRATTGTEAQLCGPVLYHALALPRVDTLYPDASSRTLLNRNLRAILRGYAAAGVPLRYFGTEVLALLGHPVALIGYDVSAAGAVLIEIMLGLENACVVRPALVREPPAPLLSLLKTKLQPMDLLQSAVRGVCDRLGAYETDVRADLSFSAAAVHTAAHDVDALPTRIRVPIGVLEAVALPQVRVTGDLLTSIAALRQVEALADSVFAARKAPGTEILLPLEGQPLDGARAQDILTVIQGAWDRVSSS